MSLIWIKVLIVEYHLFLRNVWGTHLLRRNTRRIRKKWTKRQKCLDNGSHIIIVTFVQFFLNPETYQRFSKLTSVYAKFTSIYIKLTSVLNNMLVSFAFACKTYQRLCKIYQYLCKTYQHFEQYVDKFCICI